MTDEEAAAYVGGIGASLARLFGEQCKPGLQWRIVLKFGNARCVLGNMPPAEASRLIFAAKKKAPQ